MAYGKRMICVISSLFLLAGCQSHSKQLGNGISISENLLAQQNNKSINKTSSSNQDKTNFGSYPKLFSDDLPGAIPNQSKNFSFVIDWSSIGTSSPLYNMKPSRMAISATKVTRPTKTLLYKDQVTGHTLTFMNLPSLSKGHLQYYRLPSLQQFILYTNQTLSYHGQVFLAVADGMGGVFFLTDKNGKVYKTHTEDRDSYWTIKTSEWYTLHLNCGACHTKDTTYFKFQIRSHN